MSNHQPDSYSGIVSAFNELRLRNEALPREYTANYAGIRDAILDIKKEWGNIGLGEYPPGWVPERDGDGNVIGGEWVTYPQNGDLWFDQRQGRMMVWLNGDYHQTNGADQLTVISDTQPNTPVEGALWYQQSTQSLYLYTGNQWTLVTSTSVNTNQLALAASTITDLTNVPNGFPAVTGVDTQQEFNAWTIDTHEYLNTRIDGINTDAGATVTVSTTAPTITSDGDFWYNSSTLQLYVSLNSAWQTSTPDFSQASAFTTLEASVNTLSSTTSTQISGLDTRVTSLENATDTTYSLSTPSSLRLVDSDGGQSNVSITGTGGASVSFGSNSITVDTSNLQNSLTSLQTTVAAKADQTSLTALTTSTTNADTTLQTNIDANTTSISSLSTTVAGLPTMTTLASYLPLSGGTLSGALNLGGQVINNVASPFLGSDAANRQYVDDFKTFVANTYATISGASFASLDITTSDVAVAGIDFSTSTTASRKAFEFQSEPGGTVTFGNNGFDNEMAWDFASTEDFCWKHSTQGKQLSVRSSGVYCNELSITDFVVDSNGNETLTNTVDVKDRLSVLATALQGVSSALNNNSTYAGFKTDALIALANV